MWYREFWKDEDGISKYQIVDDKENVIIQYEQLKVLSEAFVNDICRLHNLEMVRMASENCK